MIQFLEHLHLIEESDWEFNLTFLYLFDGPSLVGLIFLDTQVHTSERTFSELFFDIVILSNVIFFGGNEQRPAQENIFVLLVHLSIRIKYWQSSIY